MSGNGSSGSQEVERTKDGVPRWSGEASQYVAFEEACYLYEASVAYHKRYTCAPRIMSELTGAARRMVAGRHPDWVSHNAGVATLLNHLRQCLGKPQIPEMTEHLNRYFKQGRRRNSESMNEYITRKAEMYMRAERALQRVAPVASSSTSTTWSAPAGVWSWTAGYGTSSQGSQAWRRSVDAEVGTEPANGGETPRKKTVPQRVAAAVKTPGANGVVLAPLGEHPGAPVHGTPRPTGTTRRTGGPTPQRTLWHLHGRPWSSFLHSSKGGTSSKTPT